MIRKLYLITAIIFSLIIVVVYFYYWQDKTSQERSANTNYVSTTTEGFGNDWVEKAITDYLLTQKTFSWKTKEGSSNFCVVENLGSKDDLFPIYVWGYCGEYIFQNGKPENLSGWSGPIKINYPNELSFYDLNKFTHEIPRDGSYYSADIKSIFPEDVQQKIFNFDSQNITDQAESIANENLRQ